jgi:peptide/nickel transport system substrate-binding protein
MKQASGSHFPPFFCKHKTHATLLILFLSCLFILSACGGNNPAPNTTSSLPKKGGTLKVGIISDIANMDPLTSTSLYDSDVMANMYDTLFKYDDKGVIQPELVSSYKYASPTALDLTLRSGVKFQDGTPFNADAVIFNLNRFLTDKTGPRYSDVEDITNLTKLGDMQVQINLQKPYGPLLNVLTGSEGRMVSPTALKTLGDKFKGNPVNAGSGPFIWVEWARADHILLKANPNYWQKDAQGNSLPYLQFIRFQVMTNATVMYNNLETNQIQVDSSPDPNTVSQIKSNPSLTYRQIPSPGFGSIQINMSQPPLNNVHLRRAISLAINRQEILTHVLQGVGIVAHGPLSPASWAYDNSFTGLDYNVAQAKAELAQSGLTNPTFPLLFTAGNPTTLQEVQFIQAQLQAVGINMTLKQSTFPALVSAMDAINYQAVFVGWTGSRDPDGLMFGLWHTGGGINYTRESNPQLDALLDKGRYTTERAQRIPFYQQAQKLVVEDAGTIFITHPVISQATSSTVKNYFLSPSAVLDFTSTYLSS